MKKSVLSYKQTGYFSPLFLDYISNNQTLSSLYSEFPKIENFRKIIESKSKETIDRNVLHDTLISQYSHSVEHKKPVLDAITSLKHKDTYTLTTGHQLCLFTGPLYVIYKLITTIKLSQELKKHYPKFNFVPLFWMATEDHDFEEINKVHLFGKEYNWDNFQNGMVGNYKLDGLSELLNELSLLAHNSVNLRELLSIFKQAYSENNLANGTRSLLNELFGKYGLVVLDGNDPRFKSILTREIYYELTENAVFKAITETNKTIETLGYNPQIMPRELNVFYTQPNFRERIIFENGNYSVLNSSLSFSKTELMEEIKNYPERFSPNVFFRAIYQEKLLPNIGYIAGPSEVCYWLQMKKMFESFNILFPMIIPRNSVLRIDNHSSNKMKKLKLTLDDLFESLETLISKKTKELSDNELSLKNEWNKFETILEEINSKATLIDKSLIESVEAEKTRIKKSFDTLEGKFIRQEKKNMETNTNQIKNLKNKLFPENSLQERHTNLMTVVDQTGLSFFDTLLSNLNPLDFQFTVLEEE